VLQKLLTVIDVANVFISFFVYFILFKNCLYVYFYLLFVCQCFNIYACMLTRIPTHVAKLSSKL